MNRSPISPKLPQILVDDGELSPGSSSEANDSE